MTLLFLFELFTHGIGPVDVGATPPAQLSAASCLMCHEAEAHEWRESRHGQAWTNPIFQREYRQQPLAWCVHCHAPLAAQLAEAATGGALVDEGVNCAACHLRDGHIVAASRRANSPHDTRVQADFGAPAFCGGCHQFNFPVLDGAGGVVRYTDHPMQATVAQFEAGPYPKHAANCRTCHAGTVGGHAYPGAHDLSMLQRALALDACRAGDRLQLTVTNRGAGHNVPTGDLHRHIAVRAWRSSAPERLYEALLGRRFRPAADGGKETVLDTTLPPGRARRYRVPLGPDAADEPLNLELRYVYTIDEYPAPERAVGEPTWQTVSLERVRLRELPACGPRVRRPP